MVNRIRRTDDFHERLDEMATDGPIGLETGVVFYGLAPDRATCDELIARLNRKRLAAEAVDPVMLEHEIVEWLKDLSAEERTRMVQWSVNLWRVDQTSILLAALAEHFEQAWLRPVGAELLGVELLDPRRGDVVPPPGRHFASSVHPHLIWPQVLTRMRERQLPCEYFVSQLVDEQQAQTFVAELRRKLQEEEPAMVGRMPLWSSVPLDRRTDEDSAEPMFDPELATWRALPVGEQSVGLHLHGQYTSREHATLSMLLAAIAAVMGVRFEGAIRPHVDVFRQHA